MSTAQAGAAKAAAPQPVRLFRITDIPDVMQYRMGWPVAAQFMRRWFQATAHQMGDNVKEGDVDPRSFPASQLEERAVTMAWALGFQRVRSAYQQLLTSWDSPAGRARLKGFINQARPGQLPPKQTHWRFGNLAQSGRVLDKTCQVNIVRVGQLSDPLDDFYGAIGKGALKIAVSGLVTTLKNSRDQIEIDEVGIYLRDTYDFNDDGTSLMSQPLGFWGFQGAQRGAQLRWDIEIDEKYVDQDSVPADRLYAVQNDDFRRYRRNYGRGGDFVVYSDVHRERLAQPKVLEL